jgi:hypothetical protein
MSISRYCAMKRGIYLAIKYSSDDVKFKVVCHEKKYLAIQYSSVDVKFKVVCHEKRDLVI